ncbi:MAG: fused MFS/spermidine synthase, partial [Candidatus Rokuibacteriota bacterium]
AGIALGNYVGGLVADRGASRRTLGVLLVAGGLASLVVLPLTATDLMGLVPRGLPVVVRIVFLTGLLFFVPSAVLGMVSPVAVKLTLADLGRAGHVVGRIYAWSTLGSIAGTFLTGFVLIPRYGTRPVIFGVGVLLVALGAAAGGLFRQPGRLRAVDAALAALLLLALARIHGLDALNARCQRETSYYCIRVTTESVDGGPPLQVLSLDKLVHSYNSLADPTRLHYGYLRTYAELTAYVARRTPRLRALFIGGGGYTLPRYMEATYPDATLEVAEIDPGVTETAVELLGLSPGTRVVTYNRDAREVVEAKRGAASYDLVFGDAFNDYQVPYHLTTVEFARRVRGLLRPDGLYLVLVIDRMRGGRFMASLVRTLQEAFSHVYVLADVPRTMGPRAQTYVVAASGTPLDFDRLRSVPGLEPGGGTAVRVMPAAAMAHWLREADPVVLTDDYAPADNLMAPIFLERDL